MWSWIEYLHFPGPCQPFEVAQSEEITTNLLFPCPKCYRWTEESSGCRYRSFEFQIANRRWQCLVLVVRGRVSRQWDRSSLPALGQKQLKLKTESWELLLQVSTCSSSLLRSVGRHAHTSPPFRRVRVIETNISPTMHNIIQADSSEPTPPRRRDLDTPFESLYRCLPSHVFSEREVFRLQGLDWLRLTYSALSYSLWESSAISFDTRMSQVHISGNVSPKLPTGWR